MDQSYLLISKGSNESNFEKENLFRKLLNVTRLHSKRYILGRNHMVGGNLWRRTPYNH